MKRKILVIEKDQEKLDEISGILADAGHVVFWAKGDQEAIEIAEKTRPDVIVLFIQSPELHGFDIFQRLKNRGTTRDIGILLVIEKFVEDFVARAINLGASDYVIWPGSKDELLMRVNVVARAAEEKLKEQQALSRYREIFDGETHGFFLTTPEGKFLDCNETLVRMLGYDSKEELLEIDIEKHLYWDASDRKRFRAAMEKAGRVDGMCVHFKRKDGEKISILVSGEVVHDEKGRIIGYQGENIQVREDRRACATGDKRATGEGYVRSFLKQIIPALPFGGQLMSFMKITELIGERYEKVKRLGIGSFGEVWKVRDIESSQKDFFLVAKIPLEKKLNPQFKKEAKILEKLLGHPNAVRLEDVVYHRDLFVLIQEYVEGDTLEKKTVLGVEPRDAESIIRQLVDIVAYAHSFQIAHRDLKPENIVVQSRGNVKLLDFGSAKDLSQKTYSSTIIGSRPYMAPEQIMGKSTIASDVWAIGVIMYLLYTSYLPFYHEVQEDLVDMILKYDPIPPSEFNPDIDTNIEEIILKCLKKDLGERYRDAIELKEDLLRINPDYGKKKAMNNLNTTDHSEQQRRRSL